ncbi:MAG: peptidylprolyl isomerase [Planctomycetota bacterium]|nr:peptidylprolyl isomerase [Planctomycetota bacterium]
MKVIGRSAGALSLVVWAVMFSTGCGSDSASEVPKASVSGPEAGSDQEVSDDSPTASAVQLQAEEAMNDSPAQAPENLFPEVLVQTSLGDLRIRLNAEKAPRTVSNFLANYVDRQFYDQTIIHYVDAGFMIAGGGYQVDYQSKVARTAIRHEGDNGLKNVRGTIAMVRHAEYIHSAKSEVFINLADNPSLDYQEKEDAEAESRDPASYGYCVFGEIVEGMEVLDRIGGTPVVDKADFPRTPSTPVIIKKIERLR